MLVSPVELCMPVHGAFVDGVYWVVLDRPEKLNALDESMWAQLSSLVKDACSRDDVRVIVLYGRGRAFCTGDDIGAMRRIGSAYEAKRFFAVVGDAVRSVLSCPKPVVAAVRGYAYGGCMELLLVVDVVVASRDTRFSAPEIGLGLIPPMLITVGSLSIGLRRAKYLALTGVSFDAETARLYGLVDEVVEPEALVERVWELASVLKRHPSEPLLEIKRIANRVMLEELLDEALEVLSRLVYTEEAREKMDLFLRRRLRPSVARGGGS